MGIFDIFKKKTEPPKQPPFADENTLETVLRKAATEPAWRAEFYKLLLSEKLIVLTDNSDADGKERVLEAGTHVNLVSYKDGSIPVFTSTGKIFDKGVIKGKVPFMEMKGEDLFTLATGATFILNPYSDYGKELLPEEIQHLLNGTHLEVSHREITVEKDTQVQIGQPAVYPVEIVNLLKILFAGKPEVQSAYLGWIYNPASSDQPHLIIAIDAESSDMQSITNEAGFTAKQHMKPEDIIDFIRIDKNKTGLSDYFINQTEPFYTRQ